MGRSRNREDRMNKLIVLVVIAASALVATAAWPQQGAFQATRYFESPLEKDPTRMVRLQSEFMPPGSGNAFHRHPGDQWSAVQEGEVTFTIKGQPPRVLRAGDSIYVPRGTIHRNQNLTDKPARSINLNIMDKDQPQTEQITN
jgi:quercetin dioxygenase-like cupin family protein